MDENWGYPNFRKPPHFIPQVEVFRYSWGVQLLGSQFPASEKPIGKRGIEEVISEGEGARPALKRLASQSRMSLAAGYQASLAGNVRPGEEGFGAGG